MIIEFVIGFIGGVATGMYIYRKLGGSNKELTTEDCVKYLKDKGYTVRLFVKGN